MKKRLVTVTLVAGSLAASSVAAMATPTPAAPTTGVCVHATVTVNGSSHVISKCVP